MPCEYVSSVRDLRECPSWAATCVIGAIAGRADVSSCKSTTQSTQVAGHPRPGTAPRLTRDASGARGGDTRQPDLRKKMERPGAGRGRGETTANRTPERASHFHPLATHKLVAHCEQRVRPGSPGPWKATLKARHFGRRRGRSPARRYSGGEGNMIRKARKPARPATSPTLTVPAATSPAGSEYTGDKRR